VVHVSAEDLVYAKGLNIVITWNENIVECDSVLLDLTRLYGFSEFLVEVDNSIGRLEIVLLRLKSGGYVGDADSFLGIRFVPVSTGTARISLSNTLIDGDPYLTDVRNARIDADLQSAEIIVQEPPPSVTALHQNFPNPFNPGTTIRFDISEKSPVKLRIYDVGGRLVKALIDGEEYGIGQWDIEWDGRNDGGILVPSGIYFCVFEAAGITESRKLVVVR
jgi:hypothetical protein